MKKGRKNDEEDKTERKGLQNEIDNMKFITTKNDEAIKREHEQGYSDLSRKLMSTSDQYVLGKVINEILSIFDGIEIKRKSVYTFSVDDGTQINFTHLSFFLSFFF